LTNIIKKIGLLLISLGGVFPSKANFLANHPHQLPLVSSQHFTSAQKPEEVLPKLKKSKSQFNGIITGEVWIYARAFVGKEGNYTLEVPNASIDTIEIFTIEKNGNLTRILFGGDHVPVSKQMGGLQSPFVHRLLTAGSHEFLIKYIQKGRFQHRLIHLYPIIKFQNKKTKQLLINGLFAGFCCFLLLLSLVLGFYMKRAIFFYYAIWTTLQLIYFAISLGYFRFWFYPENIIINSTLRAFISAIIPLIFALLTIEYLDEHRLSKKTKTLIISLITVCVFLFFFERLFTDFFWKNVTPWIVFVSFISVSGIVISAIVIIKYAVTSWKKPLLVGISFILQFIITLLLIWFESEPSPFDFLEIYTYSGFLPILELIAFGVLIAWWMNQTIVINNKLLKENLLLQTKSQEIHANTVEEERKRIAMDLHDTSLNRISILSMLLTSNRIESVKAGAEIAAIGEEIRSTAYSLYSPWLSDSIGFKEVIQREVQHTLKTTELDLRYQFYDWKTEPTEIQKLHLIRIIQEFIQNTIKHSLAKCVNLHFFERENNYLIELEDDGVGYEKNLFIAGLGSVSVETRIQLLSGKISISSTPGKGVNWLIEIPINPVI